MTGNKKEKHSVCELLLKEKSDWKCIECKTLLCDNCKAPHVRVPLCCGHHMVKAGDEEDLAIDRLLFCEKHSDKPITGVKEAIFVWGGEELDCTDTTRRQ